MFQKWGRKKKQKLSSVVSTLQCVYVCVATSMETVATDSWKKFEEPATTAGLEVVSRFFDGGRQQQQQQQRLQQS